MWGNCSGRSPKMSDVSESLRSLTKNERCERIAQVAHQKWAMWANRSGRSPKMSDVSKSLRSLTKNERCEQIAQVAYQKWATMSDSLRSLRGNKRSWANRSGCSPKMSEWAHFFAKNEWFARETDERISSPGWESRIALKKIVSHFLPWEWITLFKKLTRGNRSRCFFIKSKKSDSLF